MSSLNELSAMARRLAEKLAAIATTSHELTGSVGEPLTPSSRSLSDLGEVARRYLRLRREREVLFPPNMFADPAWDILLDLFAAEVEGQRISVSSACLASAVPLTTALRWLTRLEESDLIIRTPDTSDARRVYVRLTSHARDRVAQWLQASSGAELGHAPSKGSDGSGGSWLMIGSDHHRSIV